MEPKVTSGKCQRDNIIVYKHENNQENNRLEIEIYEGWWTGIAFQCEIVNTGGSAVYYCQDIIRLVAYPIQDKGNNPSICCLVGYILGG